jgi:folate-binding protein YgfZ
MPTTLQSADAQLNTGAQLAALLHGAGIAPLDDIAWIRVTGEDRVRWLNGMVTNAIQSLAPGEGCYSFVLNAQGRIQGDLTAFALGDSVLLETGRDQIEKLLAHLDHFIIMDDVELAVVTDRSGLLIAGPDAGSVLVQLGLRADAASSLRLQSVSYCAAPVDVIHGHSPLVPRYEVWSDSETVAALTSDLIAAGAIPVAHDVIEHLRILEGTPRYGVDIRDKDLPQETEQTRALNFTKGCYLGQEIVERIRSRGAVHRMFTGFELSGSLPAPGAVLEAEGKPVGELTSIAAISTSEAGPVIKQIALGYIRREALAGAQARGLPLTYPGGVATPVALPFSVP